MKSLQTGHFFGETNTTVWLDGLTLTDTEYTHPTVDWHYHENAYFTFILEGGVVEGNRKEVYECVPGSLLFHNWQDPHYNIKKDKFTRGFHIELEPGWLEALSIDGNRLEGSRRLSHPTLQLFFYRIVREILASRAGSGETPDDLMELSVQQLLTEVFIFILGEQDRAAKKTPRWVGQIEALLRDEYPEPRNLHQLAASLGVHPVHLCRDFSKYFHCSITTYIRKLRIARSLTLLPDSHQTLTSIAFACGFADQSHFVRSFREFQRVSPSAWRKLVRGRR